MVEEEMVRRINDVRFDGNGVLTERRWINGQEVVVHHDDVPDEDIMTVDGIPCTSALSGPRGGDGALSQGDAWSQCPRTGDDGAR
jgi:hypothetical protein